MPDSSITSAATDKSAAVVTEDAVPTDAVTTAAVATEAAETKTELSLGEKVPNVDETDAAASGPFTAKIVRGSPEFDNLVENTNADIVFKDEEGTGADKMMTSATQTALDTLATKVKDEWPGKKLRVTECWDENDEHSSGSLHYEGRAADMTIDDQDGKKLGRLAQLAVDAGFDWVYYENAQHVHASVKKDS